MKFSKFGMLAATALLVSVGVSNSAHADIMGQPSAAQQAQTEAAKNAPAPEIGKILSNTMNKISDVSKTGFDAANQGLGSGMQSLGKGLQDITAPSAPAQEATASPNFTPVKPGFIDNLRKKFNSVTESNNTAKPKL